MRPHLERCGHEKANIRINKAMVPNEHFAWVIKPPKTKESNRLLTDVPSYIVDHLRSLPRDSERIIHTITPSVITQRFISLSKKLGFPYRLHDLRHYNASIMLALGIPDKYAMKRTGHATDVMLKQVYQHVMEDKDSEVSAVMIARLEELYR